MNGTPTAVWMRLPLLVVNQDQLRHVEDAPCAGMLQPMEIIPPFNGEELAGRSPSADAALYEAKVSEWDCGVAFMNQAKGGQA